MSDDTPWITLDYPPEWRVYPCGHTAIADKKEKHDCELERRLTRIEELLHSHGLFHAGVLAYDPDMEAYEGNHD